MRNTAERYKKLLLKASSAIMEQDGFESLTVSRLADAFQKPLEWIEGYFPSDNHLRMETMRYAAIVWCEQIKEQVNGFNDKGERMRFAIEQFAFGSDMYAGSLSCYVDAWHRILGDNRKGIISYDLRLALLDIYQMFQQTFLSIFMDQNSSEPDAGMSARAWLFVAISDGIHIQRLLGNTHLDKRALCDELVKLMRG